jgi:recombination protein RecA
MVFIDMGEPIPKQQIIPTPSLGLNEALGGGLRTGAFHAFWGSNQTGKTTFALQIMAEAQKNFGMIPFIIDAENSLEDDYLVKNGVDPDRRIWYRTNVVEEAVTKVKEQAQIHKNEQFIYLIDSINTLYFESYVMDPSNSSMAYSARSQTALLNKLTPYTKTSMVIVIAQQTTDIQSTHVSTKGKLAEALNHDCNTIIKLQKSNSKKEITVEDDGTVSEYPVNWKLEKTKQGPNRGQTGKYYFKPADVKIDTAREILTLACLNRLVKNSGAWYEINGEKIQGEVNAVNYLQDHEMVTPLYNELMDLSKIQTDDPQLEEEEVVV